MWVRRRCIARPGGVEVVPAFNNVCHGAEGLYRRRRVAYTRHSWASVHGVIPEIGRFAGLILTSPNLIPAGPTGLSRLIAILFRLTIALSVGPSEVLDTSHVIHRNGEAIVARDFVVEHNPCSATNEHGREPTTIREKLVVVDFPAARVAYALIGVRFH